MNKKLFSWKALAGLALLVAMGMTSCNNSTEVDPSDPTGIKTPTQPSISTKGAADVTITITSAGDLATQWGALDAKKKAELIEKTTLNVAINNAGYKLDGAVIALPDFFAGAKNGRTGKVLNITFNNGFQNAGYNLSQAEYSATAAGDVNADKKQCLCLNTNSMAGNQVNFFFPAGNFDLLLESSVTETTLNSEAGANIGTLFAWTGTSKSALKIKGGVAVKGIALLAGDVKVEGGSLTGLLAISTDATGKYAFKNVNNSWAGFEVGQVEKTYVKTLIVDRGVTATVTTGLADWQGTADAIVIKKSGNLILSDATPHVTSIVGENANATLSLPAASVDNAGFTKNFNNIGSLEKVVVTANAGAKFADTNKFNTVEFVSAVTLGGTTFANVTFNALTIPVDKDDMTFSFSKVNFKGTVTVSGSYSTTIASSSKTYQWVVDGVGGGKWQEITATAPLLAYNATETVQEFNSSAVNVTATGTLTGWNVGAVTSKVIKITTDTNKKLNPDNTLIALSSDCKVAGKAVDGSNINTVFGNKTLDQIWYTVSVDGAPYKWKAEAGTNPANYLLIK